MSGDIYYFISKAIYYFIVLFTFSYKNYLRNRMHCNLMPSIPQNLCLVIIIIGMTNEKSTPNLTPIRIPPAFKQNVRIEFPIVKIYSAIKTQNNHLGYILDVERIRSSRAVFRTETIWKLAGLFIAEIDGFWIIFGIAVTFIAAVQAIKRAVAKIFFRQTCTVCAT